FQRVVIRDLARPSRGAQSRDAHPELDPHRRVESDEGVAADLLTSFYALEQERSTAAAHLEVRGNRGLHIGKDLSIQRHAPAAASFFFTSTSPTLPAR